MKTTCKHLNNDKIKTWFLFEGHYVFYKIDGCNGDGYAVIKKIKYCPFCGKRIFRERKIND